MIAEVDSCSQMTRTSADEEGAKSATFIFSDELRNQWMNHLMQGTQTP